MSPPTLAPHPTNNGLHFPNIPLPPGSRGRDETNQKMLIKENLSQQSFLPRAEAYKVFLSNVWIFSLFPAVAQCIPIGNRDSSAGWDFFRGGARGRIQIFTPHPSRIRLLKGGDLQNLVQPLENPFPILLSPSLVVTRKHIHTHTCVLTHKLTLSH